MYKSLKSQIKNRESKKIANNTYIVKALNGALAIRLHSTDILHVTPQDDITYNTGGWQTSTTKTRMNAFGPGRITQKAGIWYITVDDKTYLYADGLTITGKGKVIGAAPVASKNAEKARKKKAALLKKITLYADKAAKKALTGNLTAPGPGDCFYCQGMDNKNGLMTQGDHVLSHFRESYIVPSLVYRALRYYNATDFIIATVFDPQNVPEIKVFAIQHLKRAIKKFLVDSFNHVNGR